MLWESFKNIFFTPGQNYREIPERGKGQIHLYAQSLSSGIYFYYLVADGVTIETKKMVCTK